jgi:hypothetical protein
MVSEHSSYFFFSSYFFSLLGFRRTTGVFGQVCGVSVLLVRFGQVCGVSDQVCGVPATLFLFVGTVLRLSVKSVWSCGVSAAFSWWFWCFAGLGTLGIVVCSSQHNPLGLTLSEQYYVACLGVFSSLCLMYWWSSRQFLGTRAVCSSPLVCFFSTSLRYSTVRFSLFSMDSAPVCVKFTGTNYSTWAFQFESFLKGKVLWGHIDGTDVEKSSTSDKPKADGSSPSWAVLDARIMSWILGSVESHIVTNLRPHRSAQSMWAYLKKVYLQDNAARRFQLEHAIAMFQHGSLSIQDYYSAFLTLWHEYAALVTADVPVAALSTIQTLHATTQSDQFLMKLRLEYEFVRSALLNRSPVPSLDVCFGELLREERLSTQAILQQSHGNSGPATVAFSAQGCGPPMQSRNLQCFCCKEYGHIALLIVLKNSALIARRRVTLSKNVVFDPRIARPKHFRLRFLFLKSRLLPHLSLLPMRPLFLPLLHPITALQQWCNRF